MASMTKSENRLPRKFGTCLFFETTIALAISILILLLRDNGFLSLEIYWSLLIVDAVGFFIILFLTEMILRKKEQN